MPFRAPHDVDGRGARRSIGQRRRRQDAHQCQYAGLDGLEAAHHVDKRREELDQGGNDDLGRGTVAEQEHLAALAERLDEQVGELLDAVGVLLDELQLRFSALFKPAADLGLHAHLGW